MIAGKMHAYLLTGLAAVAFIAAQLWNPPPPPPFVGLRGVTLPKTVAGYASLGDYTLPDKTQQALRSSETITQVFSDAGDITRTIQVALIGGTDRTALHDPRGCMTGSGYDILNDRVETLPGAGVTFRVCDMVGGSRALKDGEAPQAQGAGMPDKTATQGEQHEATYLYVVDGNVVNQVTQIRGQMLFSALVGQSNRPVYYLLLSRPRRTDDPQKEREDAARMREFAAELWNRLDLPARQKQARIEAEREARANPAAHKPYAEGRPAEEAH